MTTESGTKNIRNNIPKMIEKRLCELSKNEEVFNNIKGLYQNALKKVTLNIVLPTNNLLVQPLTKIVKDIAFITTPPFVNLKDQN